MSTIAEGLIGRLHLDWRPWKRSLTSAKMATVSFGKKAQQQSRATGRGWRQAFDRIRTSASSSFGKVRQLLGKVDKDAKKTQGSLGGLKKTLLKIGAGVGAFLGVRAMLRELGRLSQAGQDYEETLSKFQAVFKEFSAQSVGWVEGFAEQVGRSKTEILGFMATLQDTFVPLGFARDEAAKLSSQITRLGVDMASFNNAADAEVIQNLTSAIVGNHEAVRSYGISITEAALKQELFNAGLGTNIQAVTGLQKVQARLAIIMKGTTDAQGDAVRTAGSFANQMKRLKSEITGVRAEVGMAWNKVLLETIEKMGGTTAVAQKLGIVLLAVAESARIIVTVFSELFTGTEEVGQAQGGLQAAMLKTRSVMKRVEVGVRTVTFIVGEVFRLVETNLRAIALAANTVWTILSTVAKLLAGGILKAVLMVADGVADAVKALVWLGDLVGLTDDAATSIDLFQDRLRSMKRVADGLFDSAGAGLKEWKDDVDSFGKRFSEMAAGQKRSMDAIARASGEVASLDRQAKEAAADYAKAQAAAKGKAAKDTQKSLVVELTHRQREAKEKLRLEHEGLAAKVQAIKDGAAAEVKAFADTKARYKDLLSSAVAAYRKHLGAIARLDQEHARFNEGIQERIFRLQIRDVDAGAQAESLRNATREMERRAQAALQEGNFEGARGFLDRAVDFAEEVAQVDPSVPVAEVVGELQRLQGVVNDVFGREAQYHADATQQALAARAELSAALEDLEARHATWAAAMKDVLKRWAMVNASSQEDLQRFSAALDEASQKRQVFIDVSTDEAMEKIARLKAELVGLGASLSIGFAGPTPEGMSSGGWVRGPGPVGRDSVPIKAAPGEFVVTPEAASRNARLLEAINAGSRGSTTVGDVHVTVEGTGYVEADAKAIGMALRREIRRGRVKLD